MNIEVRKKIGKKRQRIKEQTWKVRTLLAPGRTSEPINELKKYKMNITAIQEMRLKRGKDRRKKSGYCETAFANKRQTKERIHNERGSQKQQKIKILCEIRRGKQFNAKRRHANSDKALIEGSLKCEKYKETIKKVAKKVCGTTKIKEERAKRTEWWNDEIRKIVKEEKTK
ncbi:hypothetical protein ILUMI_13505 [Ignelater luminosus]|uniref:Uncharacterized protein n=1 Tax=Ignelater luminosus TaxID=2038154 RepID=A0A8K0CUD4_IGNLU|nr:hypothetical protein ILUMI_13505 [Ignelater luminosus]